VTQERLPEWEDLCKVREQLTRLSMASDHYQGKSSLLRFANSGWPHFTAMQSLIRPTTKGTHAYRGTQLGTQTPAPEPVTSTPSSSKRGFSSLDDTGVSSSTSSKKRARSTPSVSTALYGLQNTLDTFTTTMRDVFTQPLPQRTSPPTAAGAAAGCLMDSIKLSKSSEGGAWLSQPEALEAFELFRTDRDASDMYLTISKKEGGEDLSRKWLRAQLELARTRVRTRASAPGGSEAP
jgi:hypothetical protein